MSLLSLLAAQVPTTAWLGLFHTDPAAVAEPTAVELQGKSYHRPMFTFVADGNSLHVPVSILFFGIPATSYVAAVGVFDQPTGGALLVSKVFASAYHFTTPGRLVFNELRFMLPG